MQRWRQADRLVNVPLAPELGLFLDKAFYDSYNTRWGDDRERLELDDFAAEVAAFKARLLQECLPARPLRFAALRSRFAISVHI